MTMPAAPRVDQGDPFLPHLIVIGGSAGSLWPLRQIVRIGVVLSGANQNGTAGLKAIRAAGGQALVQDPAEAAFPLMPESALQLGVDYCASADSIGHHLAKRCTQRVH